MAHSLPLITVFLVLLSFGTYLYPTLQSWPFQRPLKTNLLSPINNLSRFCSSYGSLKNVHLCVNKEFALYMAILLPAAAQLYKLGK